MTPEARSSLKTSSRFFTNSCFSDWAAGRSSGWYLILNLEKHKCLVHISGKFHKHYTGENTLERRKTKS